MATEPKIIVAAQRFKGELLAENDRALRQMLHAYGATWNRLKPQLDKVTKLIQEAEAAGKIPVIRAAGSGAQLLESEYSANWLFRQARYQELMYQAEVEMLQYSKQAAAMVGRQQQLGLDAGKEHAAGLMNATGVRTSWNQIPKGALQNLVGFLADGSPLDYKFVQLAPAIAGQIKDTFAAGLAQGWNPRKIAAQIQRDHQGALSNALVTCRTEALRAYRTASHETYRANADVITGWVWSAGHSPRTCLGCWSRDGEFHRLEETLTDHPSGCCVAVPQSRSWAELGFPGVDETGVRGWDPTDHFKKLSEADQIKVMGPARHELWKSGQVNLRDMGTLQRSQVWGDHYRPKTVKELTASLS